MGDTATVFLTVLRFTDAAVLVTDCESSEFWIPKSQIKNRAEIEELEEDEAADFELPEWLALREGLI